MREIWTERETAAGLKYIVRHEVRSRKRQASNINLELCLDKAVTAAMYGWSVVLSIAVAAVLVDIWR